jgi:hypothetical protein
MVMNCRAVDGRWELGCQFMHRLPAGLVMLFG